MPDNQKQWDSLWLNARVATMAGGYEVMDQAALAVQGDRIVWLGTMQSLPGKPASLAKHLHDAKGFCLTPGLVDCHTHMVFAGNRAEEFEQRQQGKTYEQIAKAGGGILSTVRATRAASEEELLRQSEQRLQSFLREGVTTIEIKSGYGLDVQTEMKMLRAARRLAEKYPVTIRTTFLGAHATAPEFAGKPDDYIEMVCKEMLPAIAKENLADAVDGFCDSIAFSPKQMQRVFDAAQKLQLPLKLHAGQLSDQGGASLAAGYKALSADHLEHVDESCIKEMAKAGTVAVLLPGAFYMLKETKKPPVELFRKHKVRIALASDCNPGTSPICSLLSIINMGCVLFGLTPEEALLGVTQSAAKALGMEGSLGTLEVGKQADLALWDIAHPAELAYYLGYNPCRAVVKNGVLREL